MKTELSKKNKWWIPKHRRLELQHFCLQYPDWAKEAMYISNYVSGVDFTQPRPVNRNLKDVTGELAERLAILDYRMQMVKDCAYHADSELCFYIRTGVTRGWVYPRLKTKMDIPCCQDTYYDRLRKFFWFLDKARN